MMHIPYHGYTWPKTAPATKPQMLALRDLCLALGVKEAASAIDNAIEQVSAASRKLAEEALFPSDSEIAWERHETLERERDIADLRGGL